MRKVNFNRLNMVEEASPVSSYLSFPSRASPILSLLLFRVGMSW